MLACLKAGRRPSQAPRSTLVVVGDNRSKRTELAAVRSLLGQMEGVMPGD